MVDYSCWPWGRKEPEEDGLAHRGSICQPCPGGRAQERGPAFFLGLQLASSLAQESRWAYAVWLTDTTQGYSGSNRVHRTWNVPFAYAPGKWWQQWAADRGYGVGSFLGPSHPKCGIKGPAGAAGGGGREGNSQKSYSGTGKL